MAFAKRLYPLTVGAEAACEVVAVGADVTSVQPGDRVVPYSALTCGTCAACRRGRDNLCENVAGVRGFHIDGFAQDLTNHPARLLVKIPDGVVDAAMPPASLSPMARSSTCCSTMPSLSRANGCWCMPAAPASAASPSASPNPSAAPSSPPWVRRTKAEKAKALGADHVINYREDRFEGVVRKLTKKKGVDVVFEHTGADTWAGSLLSMKRGGRLVTCGATSGPVGNLNLMQLFQQQYRITGSFGAPMSALARALDRIASGVKPVIDTVYGLADFRAGRGPAGNP